MKFYVYPLWLSANTQSFNPNFTGLFLIYYGIPERCLLFTIRSSIVAFWCGWQRDLHFFYNIWNLWNFILSSLAGSTICIIDMRALYLFLLIIVLAHSPWYKILVPWYLLKLLTEQVHGKLVVLSDFWFLLVLFQSTHHPCKHWLAYWLIHNIVCIFICMPYYLVNELLIKI